MKHLEDQQPEYLREGKPSTLAKRRKGAGANLEAIKKLSRKISKFEGFCNKEISKLQDMTKDLVELVSECFWRRSCRVLGLNMSRSSRWFRYTRRAEISPCP